MGVSKPIIVISNTIYVLNGFFSCQSPDLTRQPRRKITAPNYEINVLLCYHRWFLLSRKTNTFYLIDLLFKASFSFHKIIQKTLKWLPYILFCHYTPLSSWFIILDKNNFVKVSHHYWILKWAPCIVCWNGNLQGIQSADSIHTINLFTSGRDIRSVYMCTYWNVLSKM